MTCSPTCVFNYCRAGLTTLRDLSTSLADIAAFMHEVEVSHGFVSRKNDGHGVERIRQLAYRLQNLPVGEKVRAKEEANTIVENATASVEQNAVPVSANGRQEKTVDAQKEKKQDPPVDQMARMEQGGTANKPQSVPVEETKQSASEERSKQAQEPPKAHATSESRHAQHLAQDAPTATSKNSATGKEVSGQWYRYRHATFSWGSQARLPTWKSKDYVAYLPRRDDWK